MECRYAIAILCPLENEDENRRFCVWARGVRPLSIADISDARHQDSSAFSAPFTTILRIQFILPVLNYIPTNLISDNSATGAGGKGGPSRTHAIDNIACKRFIHAAYTSPSVKKFLLVSYPGSRRNKPSWWTADQWASAEQVNNGALANYYKAKVASDEYLYSAFLKAKTEGGGREFAAIDLRPGRLTEEDDRTVELGKTRGSDSISRKTVAEVAVGLLENGYGGGYVDLTKGGEPWEAAVKRVVSEGVDAVEGENLSAIEAVFEKEPKM